MADGLHLVVVQLDLLLRKRLEEQRIAFREAGCCSAAIGVCLYEEIRMLRGRIANGSRLDRAGRPGNGKTV
ncbi:hypothetical protein PCCS19_30660 [Paenibacillus sp. CCS19]|nr:hypothetical protein PCCS19_30660 [Paenibacillus cellulosilyticus]